MSGTPHTSPVNDFDVQQFSAEKVSLHVLTTMKMSLVIWNAMPYTRHAQVDSCVAPKCWYTYASLPDVTTQKKSIVFAAFPMLIKHF